MGRKSIPILLKATSPEGETKTFISISEAAKELGFSKRGVGKAFHKKRSRIGEYELESSYIYHFSTVIDFSSEKYSGSTRHRNSWYQ